MEAIWKELAMNPERAVLAALTAALLGIVYAGIIHLIYKTDPHTPYTAWFVAFGVTLTLLTTAIIVPVQYVAICFVVFGITGTFQFLGAILRDLETRRRRHADEARTIKESLPK